MSVKLLSESMGSTMTDDDQARIEQILSFWFKEQELSAPQIDRRMDIWFGEQRSAPALGWRAARTPRADNPD